MMARVTICRGSWAPLAQVAICSLAVLVEGELCTFAAYELVIDPGRSVVHERDELLDWEDDLDTSGFLRLTLDPDPFQSAMETGTVQFSDIDVVLNPVPGIGGDLMGHVLTTYPATYRKADGRVDVEGSTGLVNHYVGSFDGDDLSMQGKYCEPVADGFCYEFEVMASVVRPALQAGDADQDLDFDRFDLIRVQQAAKYLTGQPATWGEGDWNGAPGGSPGDPPEGDGQFNQLDIIAALATPCLPGPYNGGGPPELPPQDLVSRIAPPSAWQNGNVQLGYEANTGEVWIDPPEGIELTSIDITSQARVFTGEAAQNLGGAFDEDADGYIFKATFGGSFGDISFGNVAQPGLPPDFLLSDWSVAGSLAGGGGLSDVNLVYVRDLLPGDANQDFSFDQLDIVKVLQAGKYLTGQPATWGEGDWDGGPGGRPGAPPAGDGLFDQKDIVAALQTGAYLSKAYAAIRKGGVRGDDQTSIIYDPGTGEIAVDVPAGTQLTSINIDSAACIFGGDGGGAPALNLGGSFDNDTDCNIFKATFGSSFGSLSFGNVAQSGLSEEFVANDLTVVGSLAGGGDLGEVDLIYVPEPGGIVLAVMGLVAGLLAAGRKRPRRTIG